MGKNKRLDYRADGFIFALLFLADYSLPELLTEIEWRDKTGVRTIIPFRVLNKEQGMIQMSGYINEAQNTVWCIALRRMGFGKNRILRNLNRVMERQANTIEEAYELREENDIKLKQILKANRYKDERLYPNLTHAIEEYINCREEGLKYAAEVCKTQGLQAFRKMVTKTKYCESMVKKENDHANDVIRSIFNEAIILSWLVSLSENEGFGNYRMNKTLDAFEEAYEKLCTGKEGYENYIDEIQEVTGVRLSSDWLKHEPNYKKVKHKKKKPKKKKPEPKEEVKLPPINEPQEYYCYPCRNCSEKPRCRAEGYQHQCTCLALYKEVRKANVRANLGIA